MKSKHTPLDPRWKQLYLVAGILALFNVLLIVVQIVLFSMAPPPALHEAKIWLELFASNPVLGFINLDVLLMVNNAVLIPLYVALYVALKHENESMMLLGLLLGLVGLAVYFPSNPSVEMYNLSLLYQAGNADEQASLLSSAQAIMMNWHGSAFVVYYYLEAIILLIFGAVMLRNTSFGKLTAWLGIVSGVLMCVPSTFGTVGLIFSFLSLIPWMGFSILLGIRFVREGIPK